MKATMGSRTLRKISEEERKGYAVEEGDIVLLERFTHVFGDPPGPDGKPHIAKGSMPLKAAKGDAYNMIFLGRSRMDSPLTDEEIEKRMNRLGWYRKTES
jgi:hypothetical protein